MWHPASWAPTSVQLEGGLAQVAVTQTALSGDQANEGAVVNASLSSLLMTSLRTPRFGELRDIFVSARQPRRPLRSHCWQLRVACTMGSYGYEIVKNTRRMRWETKK